MKPSEVQKVWQPGNLIARKFLKSKALEKSFWILLQHSLTITQFGGSVKEMIIVLLQNGHTFHTFVIISKKSNRIKFDVIKAFLF